MAKKSLKCYGIYIDTAEVIINIPHGVMDEFLKDLSIVGVYQDVGGQRQVIIFNKKDQAKKAVQKAKSLGFDSVELCPTMIYVPETDIGKPLDVEGLKDESINGD